MDSQVAEDIYFTLCSNIDFDCNCPTDKIDRLTIEREKISSRYKELKSRSDFLISKRIATVEWLMEYLDAYYLEL